MKKFLVIALFFFAYYQAFSFIDTLRHYTPGTPSIYYTAYPVQIARFELPKPGSLLSIIVTLGGDDPTGSAEIHVYGHEGGNSIPSLEQDLCDPIAIQKTMAGDERIELILAQPIYQSNNQFFISLKNFQNGARLASDSVVYTGFCLAGASGGDFYWEYVQSASGTTYYQTRAFKIDVIVQFDTLPSNHYLQEATASAGIPSENYSNRGLAVGDFDNDGDDDLIRRNLLLRNDNGVFSDITVSAGISGNPFSSTFADMDNDGLLDIVWVLADTILIYRNLDNESFSLHVAATSTTNSGYTGTQSMCVADINNDKYPDIFIGRLWNTYPTPLPNYLYLNNQNLALVDNTSTLYSSASQNLRRTRGCTFVDFDNDSDVDLYVTNYYLERDEFFQNNGDGTFSNIIASKEMDENATGSNHGTGGIWGDYDNDSDMDLLLPQFAHPNYVVQYDHRGTTIYRNEGPPSYVFTDLIGSPTIDDDIQLEETHAGASFGDINNDGLLDFYISNFYNCRYSDIYIQNASHRFELKTLEYLPSQSLNTGEDVILFDYNNDGKLDVLTAYYNSNVALFQNVYSEPNNYLKLNLRSISGNSFALGGKATVHAGGRIFTREVFSGHGANMHDSYILHFGLGQIPAIDSVVVRWPVQPAKVEIFHNITVNSHHVLTEGTGVIGLENPSVAGLESVTVYPNPATKDFCISIKTNLSQTIHWGIFDEIGRRIMGGVMDCETNKPYQIKINPTNGSLSPGFYIYQVGSISGKLIIN